MFAFNEEGYANGVYQNSNSEPTYSYYRRDHLGNNREVWRAAYTIASTNYVVTTTQRIQYYPSGLPWGEATGIGPGAQPYKFNGCEFIEDHGYDVTDLGNRVIHNARGSFDTMDRFAEKFPWQSPYVHAGNNPVNYVDVNGDSIWFYVYEGNTAQRVQFSGLDLNIQKALVIFASSQVGYNFFAQFANAGDSFGSEEAGGIISFTETGKNSIHNYNVMQYSVDGANDGDSGSRPIINGKPMQFDMRINTERKDGKTPENYSVTIAHENFVHLEQHIDIYSNFLKAGKINEAKNYRKSVEYKDYYPGTTDHNNYSKGTGIGYEMMMKFGQQNPKLMPLIKNNVNKYKK